jgi:hypothetical protein
VSFFFLTLRRIATKQTRNVIAMYLIPIAWIYVTLMMAVAEATNTDGTLLGALFTFLLYGLLPVGLVLYFMATPARRRARDAAQAREDQASAQAAAALAAEQAPSGEPDASSLTATDPVAPVRKEP